jgi:hypothetical protein
MIDLHITIGDKHIDKSKERKEEKLIKKMAYSSMWALVRRKRLVETE